MTDMIATLVDRSSASYTLIPFSLSTLLYIVINVLIPIPTCRGHLFPKSSHHFSSSFCLIEIVPLSEFVRVRVCVWLTLQGDLSRQRRSQLSQLHADSHFAVVSLSWPLVVVMTQMLDLLVQQCLKIMTQG